MKLDTLIAECTAYDFKLMLEEKKPKSWLKSVSVFADTQNVGDHDGDMSETKLTERQQKMFYLIKKSPTITGKQMSETLSVSQRTIERDISVLKEMGVLRHEGKDNDGVWIVSKV